MNVGIAIPYARIGIYTVRADQITRFWPEESTRRGQPNLLHVQLSDGVQIDLKGDDRTQFTRTVEPWLTAHGGMLGSNVSGGITPPTEEGTAPAVEQPQLTGRRKSKAANARSRKTTNAQARKAGAH